METVCADGGRKGRDGSGVLRAESGCGEGADEADTKVSFDNELEDLRIKLPGPFSPAKDVTKDAVVLDARVCCCDVGCISGRAAEAGLVPSEFVAIRWDDVRLGCGDKIKVFA